MAGSRNSMILFLLAMILLIIQAGISIVVFDDGIGALAGGSFALIMLIEALMAKSGALSAVTQQTVTDGPGYRTVTTWDTGERVQMTPCCGIFGGIAIIFVGYLFAEFMPEEALIALAPAFIAAILSILAGIVFAVEYKGQWTRRDF